jgi:hypothetical protein
LLVYGGDPELESPVQFAAGRRDVRMSAERAEALEVLRDVWRGQAQAVADLDDSCESHCKKMTDAGVGFDDYAAGDATGRITAWRARLEREGKLSPAGSLRDLIMRPSETAETTADTSY